MANVIYRRRICHHRAITGIIRLTYLGQYRHRGSTPRQNHESSQCAFILLAIYGVKSSKTQRVVKRQSSQDHQIHFVDGSNAYTESKMADGRHFGNR